MYYINEKIESSDRYNFRKFCEFNAGIYDDFSSYFIEQLKKLPISGYYTISTSQFRPDVYSRDIYGSTSFWRVILSYNNIVNLNQLTLGTILVFPDISDMESLYFQLKTLKEVRK